MAAFRWMAAVLAVTLAASAGLAQQGGGSAARGEYIVLHVAQCVQCHTPRSESGALLMGQMLQGAPVPVRSPFPGVQWANTAPRIAGMPGYTVDAGVKLLMTGIARTGQPLRPPMPPFRMNEQDARDVVTYLKSLGNDR